MKTLLAIWVTVLILAITGCGQEPPFYKVVSVTPINAPTVTTH